MARFFDRKSRKYFEKEKFFLNADGFNLLGGEREDVKWLWVQLLISEKRVGLGQSVKPK